MPPRLAPHPRHRRLPVLPAAIALLGALALLTRPVAAARTPLAHYTTRDGLPQSQVSALAQGGDGSLWVGTNAGGVARYNGDRWEVFDASSGLPGGGVGGFALDSGGRLHVATNGGAARFEDGRWSSLPTPGEPLSPSVTVLAALAGETWLGTPSGLLLQRGAAPPRPAFPGEGVVGAEVWAIEPAGPGSLWVGTARGLARVTLGSPPRVEAVPGLPAGGVPAVLHRPDRPTLVAVSGKGLFAREGTAWRRVGDDDSPGLWVLALAAAHDEAGGVWLGTDDKGAFLWTETGFEPLGPRQGLPDSHVYAILEDREGVVWLGHEAGLTKRRPTAFLTHDESDGLPAGVPVFDMAETRDGTLWMSAWDRGLIRLPRRGPARLLTRGDGLPAQTVYDVQVDAGGVLWVAMGRGLGRLEGDRVALVPVAGREPESVFALGLRRDGALLLGDGRGLGIVRDGAFERVAALAGRTVQALHAAADGTVWAGGEGWGAVAVRGTEVVERLGREQGLPSVQVNGLFVDSAGTLWVATDRGAWSRDAAGRVALVDRSSGLPDSFVYWVGEDHERALWFGTNRGVARRPRGGALEVFTARDGLGDDECNEDGFFVSREGAVYVGSVGVSRYVGTPRPRRAVDPPVRVEAVSVSGRLLPPSTRFELPPAPGPLTFRFAAPSFMDERAVRFRYRLLGLSSEWAESGPAQHETTYGGLGAGEYVFEVTARTGDGRVSARPATVAFTVRPRWWQTRAALLLGTAGLGLGLAALVRARERRLVRARRALEALVAERTEELGRANARLAELVVTDDLTRTANRRRILEELAAAIARARRQRTPLSVALADLDHFKQVNDTLGHAEGDRLLVAAAHAMQRSLREVDLLGRYGGEEFAAVLPGCDAAGAREAAERLRRAVEGLGFVNPATGRLATVSLGTATLDAEVADVAALVHRADVALYRAKAAGRNRVVAYGAGGAPA